MQPIETSTTAAPPPPRPVRVPVASGVRQRPRSMHLALFFGSIALYRFAASVASSTASGFATRLNLDDAQPLLESVALLFLIVVGIGAMHVIERRLMPFRWSLGLPTRPTSREEWGLGAAVGWGIALLCVLGMLMAHRLNLQLWLAARAFWLLFLSAATLALITLAKVLALYGYGFQHLTEAIGEAKASVLMVAIVTLDALVTSSPEGTADGSRVLVAAVAALILCLCWIRTHAAWLGWGLWFGWAASTALLFGLPIGGNVAHTAVVDARVNSPVWLTGGYYGPAASAFLALLLLFTIPLLVRLTADYAWNYTRKPIVPAGIPVDIPAPAAHSAIEDVPAPPSPSLVQIQPAAPSSEDVSLR